MHLTCLEFKDPKISPDFISILMIIIKYSSSEYIYILIILVDCKLQELSADTFVRHLFLLGSDLVSTTTGS